MNRSLSSLIGAAVLSAAPFTLDAAEPALETCSQTFIAHLAATHVRPDCASCCRPPL